MKRLNTATLFESGDLSHDLAGKAVRSGIIIMASQGGQFLLRIIGTVVLARLLTPQDYGLFGMVSVVVSFAVLFKDAGLSIATIQRERVTHEQISNLFWVNVFFSGILGLAVFVSAPLIATFYGRPELESVAAVLSASLVFGGLIVQHEALLRRHMRFGVLATVRILSQVLSLVVSISLGLLGCRYWALVAGALSAAIFSAVLTFYLCPWVPSLPKRWASVRDMLKFGGYVTGFNFANYFARNSDSILVGRYIGADALGLYSSAYQLFIMPIVQIRGPIEQVSIPALSSLRNQPERFINSYRKFLDVLASLTMPLTVYCAVEANFIVGLILGDKWLAAIPVFQILSVAGFIQAGAGTRGAVLISMGLSERYFLWGLVNAVICVLAFVIGLPYGIKGVAVAYTVANYLLLFPSLSYCFSKTPVTVSLFLKTIFPPLVATLAAAGVLVIGRSILGDSVGAHLSAAGLFAGTYFALSWRRKSIRDALGQIFRGFPINYEKKPEVA